VDTASELVRNVTIIVLVAGFLEMLLPSSEMKRFIKMVMGLFILISILNPLLSLFDRNVTSEVLAWQDPVQGMELNTILKKGKSLSRKMDEKALELYGKSLAKQIETVVKLVKGVAWVEADVEMKKSGKKPNYDQIDRVVIVVGTGENNIPDAPEKIAPIEVRIEKQNKEVVRDSDKEMLKQQITETLQDFYGLKEDQIHIVIMTQ